MRTVKVSQQSSGRWRFELTGDMLRNEYGAVTGTVWHGGYRTPEKAIRAGARELGQQVEGDALRQLRGMFNCAPPVASASV